MTSMVEAIEYVIKTSGSGRDLLKLARTSAEIWLQVEYYDADANIRAQHCCVSATGADWGSTLKGSFSHTYGTWERVLRLLAGGALDPTPLVSRTAPLDDWRACFDGMGAGELIKAVLLPNGTPA